ncbi:MAG: hypothetical protein AAGA55_01545, partial [Planctomycetota bacterium]
MILAEPNNAEPTLWGLTPAQLHARFWAARGVQVVAAGSQAEIRHQAELYLLAEPEQYVIMPLRRSLELLCWLKPDLLLIRIADRSLKDYREIVESRADGRFLRFRRDYAGHSDRLGRVALTSDPEIARDWSALSRESSPWRAIRKLVPSDLRASVRERGQIYSGRVERDNARFARDLAETWSRPDATISRIDRVGREAWAFPDTGSDADQRITGPVWVGAGRRVPPGVAAVGPAVMWDDPEQRPVPDELSWGDIEAKSGDISERRIEEAAP